jgi:hypothetical protein
VLVRFDRGVMMVGLANVKSCGCASVSSRGLGCCQAVVVV